MTKGTKTGIWIGGIIAVLGFGIVGYRRFQAKAAAKAEADVSAEKRKVLYEQRKKGRDRMMQQGAAEQAPTT